jgi:hypothetical protein
VAPPTPPAGGRDGGARLLADTFSTGSAASLPPATVTSTGPATAGAGLGHRRGWAAVVHLALAGGLGVLAAVVGLPLVVASLFGGTVAVWSA